MSTATKPANVVCDPETGVCRYVPAAPLPTTADDAAATAAASAPQPASTHPNLKHLGTELLGQAGAKVPTASLLGHGKYIGLYFSAHWCPPCRQFTPKLAEFYTAFKASHPQAANFDIVFVSSDRDQASFDSYFASMPWLALPFDLRDAKSKLSSKFKVRGIPTFIILNADTGDIVTADGRSAILSDPTAAKFPWAPRTYLEAIGSATLVNAAGEERNFDQALAGKVSLVYFSAHWCPPCRQFTPQLAATYQALKAVDRPVEVVFVSADRSPEQFKEYLGEMPWLAVKYEDEELREELGEIFGVEGYPTLVVVDEAGKTVTDEGRRAVAMDPQGADFPWVPAPRKPLERLTEDTVDQINEAPVVIFAGEGAGAEGRAQGVLGALAQEVKGGPDADEVNFLWGSKDDELVNKVLAFVGVEGAGEQLVIVDVPSQKKFVFEEAEVGQETAVAFVRKFLAGELAGAPLR